MRRKAVFETKTCVTCGKNFSPDSATQKYCRDCGKKAEAKRKRDWYFAHNPNAGKRSIKHYCAACGLPAVALFNGKHYCNKHWLRLYTNGTLELQGKKRKTIYTIDGDYVYGKTSGGAVFKFDKSMYDKVSKHSWCRSGTNGYFVATINQKQVRLHRFILGLKDKRIFADHINGDPSDNTLANLRICTQAQNGKNIKTKSNNTSGQAGVDRLANGRWRARIFVNGKEIRIGTYDTFDLAKKARLGAEEKYFKEYSPSLSRTRLCSKS